MGRTFLAIVICFGIAGCSSSSFVGRGYEDFTAYYNTYYNAKRSFEKAEESSTTRSETIDRDRYLEIYQLPTVGAGNDLEQAIKKSADILRKHDTSKWVDDALMLIGKSYFFSQNYSAAEQKFNEVIELGTGLSKEAHFWLGRSLVASGNYEEASAAIRIVLDEEDLGKRWQPLTELVLAEAHLKMGQWDAAEELLTSALPKARDKHAAARGQFLLGQILERRGSFEEARDAYRRVAKFNPQYELEYAAAYKAGEMEGLYVDPEQALRTVRKMERNDKHFGYQTELALLRGNILYAAGRFDEAADVFEEILYDSERLTQGVRGRAQYALGLYYRDVAVDFTRAAAHFDTASVQLRGRNNQQQNQREDFAFAPGAITDAEGLSETFGSFADVYGRLVEIDSLLVLGSLSEEEFDARIEEIRIQRAIEFEEQRKLEEERRIKQQFEAGANQNSERGESFNQTKAAEIGSTSSASGEAGFLFHKDLNIVRENLQNFFEVWGQRPLAPNWRYLSLVEAAAQADGNPEGEVSAEVVGVDDLPFDILPPVDVTAVPRDPEARLQMLEERAEVRYDLGNVLFLAMNRPDSALYWYNKVIDEGGSDVARKRAYYAVAEVHESTGNTVAAETTREQLLEVFPDALDSTVEDSVAVRTVLTDSARVDYDKLFQRWELNGPTYVLADSFLIKSHQFAETELAPKHLLAGAKVHGEALRADSISLLEPIQTNLPDSFFVELGMRPADSTGLFEVYVDDLFGLVSARYPGSPYANFAREATAVFAEARRGSEDEPEKELPVANTDSVAVPDKSTPRVELEREREDRGIRSGVDTPIAGEVEETEPNMAEQNLEKEAERMAKLPDPPETPKENESEEPLSVDDVKRRLAERNREDTTEEKTVADTANADTVAVDGTQSAVYDSVAVMPVLIGGIEKLLESRILPEFEEGEELSGAVLVEFTVETDGSVGEATVKTSLGPGYDEEALRLIKSARFVAGRLESGEPARVRMSLPVIF